MVIPIISDSNKKFNYPLIIDGGLSNVLEEAGCNLNHPLWTAYILEHQPEAIIQAHLKYIKSGAQCITTASYQASIQGLIKNGYELKKAKALILKSVQLAELAIEKALHLQLIDARPLIAASIGPYGAYLADGSEYKGEYGISDRELKHFHGERIKLLDDSNADLFACETIPSFQEVKVLSELLLQVEKPAWVSFSCRDGSHLNDGTPIKDAVAVLQNHPKIWAIGANCTKPEYISEIISVLKLHCWEKKVIVYPNSGEAYNFKTKTWQELSEPLNFVEMCEEWLEKGADIIGGCCRISPAHIQGMKERLKV